MNEALARLFEYDMKNLSNTPTAGVLDLADFSEEDVVEWAKGFNEMMSKIESIKIPVLYKHEKPSRFTPFGNTYHNPKEQWKHHRDNMQLVGKDGELWLYVSEDGETGVLYDSVRNIESDPKPLQVFFKWGNFE